MRRHAREAAITAALRDNGPDLLAYFLRRVERDEAADAVGEVMTVAWRRVRDLPDDPVAARMWLFGIARKILLTVQRGRLRRSKLADRLRDTVASEAPAADAGVEIRDAIARLDADLAEVVRLVHWDGFSLAEAARLLGVPESTIRGRYQRAKRVLRAELAPSVAGAASDPASGAARRLVR